MTLKTKGAWSVRSTGGEVGGSGGAGGWLADPAGALRTRVCPHHCTQGSRRLYNELVSSPRKLRLEKAMRCARSRRKPGPSESTACTSHPVQQGPCLCHGSMEVPAKGMVSPTCGAWRAGGSSGPSPTACHADSATSTSRELSSVPQCSALVCAYLRPHRAPHPSGAPQSLPADPRPS